MAKQRSILTLGKVFSIVAILVSVACCSLGCATTNGPVGDKTHITIGKNAQRSQIRDFADSAIEALRDAIRTIVDLVDWDYYYHSLLRCPDDSSHN